MCIYIPTHSISLNTREIYVVGSSQVFNSHEINEYLTINLSFPPDPVTPVYISELPGISRQSGVPGTGIIREINGTNYGVVVATIIYISTPERCAFEVSKKQKKTISSSPVLS